MSVLFAVIVVSAAVVRLASRRSDASVADQKLAIPSYFWPGADWSSLIASVGIVDTAIVNIESGPGSTSSPAFASVVAQGQAAGLHLVGYVDTSYGTRLVGDVLADVDRYHNWYGIDRVFLDETPSDCAHNSYFTTIYNAVHARVAGQVIVNPGTNPMECAVAVSDVIVNFEGTAASYQGWSPAAWVANYPATHFWHLVYGTPATTTADVVALSRTRNAGFVYVTDDDFPNPWDGLGSSSSWAALLSVWNPRRAAPIAAGPASTAPRAAAPSAGPTIALAPSGPPTVSTTTVSTTTVSTTQPLAEPPSTKPPVAEALGEIPAATVPTAASGTQVPPSAAVDGSVGPPTIGSVATEPPSNSEPSSTSEPPHAPTVGSVGAVPAALSSTETPSPPDTPTAPTIRPRTQPIVRLLVGGGEPPVDARQARLSKRSVPIVRVPARRSLTRVPSNVSL